MAVPSSEEGKVVTLSFHHKVKQNEHKIIKKKELKIHTHTHGAIEQEKEINLTLYMSRTETEESGGQSSVTDFLPLPLLLGAILSKEGVSTKS